MNTEITFEWDPARELDNVVKHGVNFSAAKEAFADPRVIHLEDESHSSEEDRFYAVGRISKGDIVTVRYTVRGRTIRIFGAAKWRRWRKYDERENSKSR